MGGKEYGLFDSWALYVRSSTPSEHESRGKKYSQQSFISVPIAVGSSQSVPTSLNLHVNLIEDRGRKGCMVGLILRSFCT